MSENVIVDQSAKRKNVSAKEFVRAFRTVQAKGGTYTDVANVLGMKTDTVKQRRNNLNKASKEAGKPLNLPSLSGGSHSRIDFDELLAISTKIGEDSQ